jgi:putative drug exporter of the RND superfamily
MSRFFSTSALARASAHRPWRTVSAWVIVLVLAIVMMGSLGIKTTSTFDFVNQPESLTGLETLEDAGLIDAEPTEETVIVQSDSLTVDDPAFQARANEIISAVLGLEGVVVPESVLNYYDLAANPQTEAMAQGLVSQDRMTLLIPLELAGTQDEAVENAPEYRDTLKSFTGDGFEVLPVGFISAGEESNVIAEEDLVKGEGFGVAAGLVILVVVFAALIAAGVPILLAIMSITISFGVTAILSQIWEPSFFITNMITMIGLAVGIDYALFVVERYREERRHGRDKLDAIAVTGGSASKAVAFSGGTVVLALIGMFIIPASIFRALATGAIIVVVISVIAALTLVPAILSLLGDKIDWPRKRDYAKIAQTRNPDDVHDFAHVYQGFWGRVTKTVMARPVISVIVTVVLLVALSVPYWDIKAGFAGSEALPASSDAHRGFEILNEDFSAGRLSPVQFAIVGDPESAEAGVERLRTSLSEVTIEDGASQVPAFLPVPEGDWVTWNEAGDVGLAEVTFSVASNDTRAFDLIDDLREDVVPAAFDGTGATVYVTGETAFNQDFFTLVADYTPIIVGFVLIMSFLLLLLAFRSVVVSAKAIVMNLLSVGAAYGLLVLVFQKGVGNEIFGFQQTPTIEAWLPLFLFCVLFGLSMDYHVFLLSRIREHYDLTSRNRESVAVGLHSTAKIIAGAALIMVAVFGGFAAGRLVMLQQMGFGLGVAVLLDATIVRSVLVPSAMALLGDRNWYMPTWLRWLPDLRVEGTPPPAPQLDGPDGATEPVMAD